MDDFDFNRELNFLFYQKPKRKRETIWLKSIAERSESELDSIVKGKTLQKSAIYKLQIEVTRKVVAFCSVIFKAEKKYKCTDVFEYEKWILLNQRDMPCDIIGGISSIIDNMIENSYEYYENEVQK